MNPYRVNLNRIQIKIRPFTKNTKSKKNIYSNIFRRTCTNITHKNGVIRFSCTHPWSSFIKSSIEITKPPHGYFYKYKFKPWLYTYRTLDWRSTTPVYTVTFPSYICTTESYPIHSYNLLDIIALTSTSPVYSKPFPIYNPTSPVYNTTPYQSPNSSIYRPNTPDYPESPDPIDPNDLDTIGLPNSSASTIIIESSNDSNDSSDSSIYRPNTPDYPESPDPIDPNDLDTIGLPNSSASTIIIESSNDSNDSSVWSNDSSVWSIGDFDYSSSGMSDEFTDQSESSDNSNDEYSVDNEE